MQPIDFHNPAGQNISPVFMLVDCMTTLVTFKANNHPDRMCVE